MPGDRLTKYIFDYDYQMCNERENWCCKIKSVFEQLNCTEVFNDKVLCDLDKCKAQLFTIAETTWKQDVLSKPKLRTYVKFKNELTVSDHVKFVFNRYERSLLSKFRCGILQLHIETGRFNQVQLEERLCAVCNMNCIEDEFHFLCICPLYGEERQYLYNAVSTKEMEFNMLDDEAKFIHLMHYHSKYVARYIKTAWDKRKQILFN